MLPVMHFTSWQKQKTDLGDLVVFVGFTWRVVSQYFTKCLHSPFLVRSHKICWLVTQTGSKSKKKLEIIENFFKFLLLIGKCIRTGDGAEDRVDKPGAPLVKDDTARQDDLSRSLWSPGTFIRPIETDPHLLSFFSHAKKNPPL